MKAIFRIENITALQPGLPPEATFSQRGGFIGSSSDATWQIQDADDAIPPTAARILIQGNHFTIEPLNGAEIRINEARSPVPAGRPVILSDKDRIQIGQIVFGLSLGARFSDDVVDVSDSLNHVVGGKSVSDALVVNGELVEASTKEVEVLSADAEDPLEVLSRRTSKSSPSDPMLAFNALSRSEAPDGADEVFDAVAEPAIKQKNEAMGDQSDWHFSAMPQTRVQRDEFGFEEESRPRAHPDRPDMAALGFEEDVDHIALRPLTRALGLQLGEMPTNDAHRVLADIGYALRNALTGLNKLYRMQRSNSRHFQLSKMHMHALEDNPIQFSDDVDEALHAFFSKRGPVHLSAPAAFEETTEHLIAHQGASEQAIDTALETVMTALSPGSLQKRFRSYENEPDTDDPDALDAWCWRMYRAYFKELRSERQRGLQMLFWEVFSQEYQQDMRRRERARVLDLEDDQ